MANISPEVADTFENFKASSLVKLLDPSHKIRFLSEEIVYAADFQHKWLESDYITQRNHCSIISPV